MRIFLKRLGEAVMALGSLAVSVAFWLCIATVVLVSTVFIRVTGLIKAEPRVIGVVIYLIAGAWLVYSLLFGVGTGLSRIPAGF